MEHLILPILIGTGDPRFNPNRSGSSTTLKIKALNTMWGFFYIFVATFHDSPLLVLSPTDSI
ncbi:MAG: hypothetical protein IPH57_09440 [Saprospiraceae bacterium]|nr:hypothetical protein [Saprospiraceae bacterium]